MSLITIPLHNYKLSLCGVTECWNPLFFLFRSSSFGKWVHVFPRERGSSGLPSNCLSSWTRLRGPLLQPVCITIWFDNARHRWGGKVSALHVATEYSWYDVLTAHRHCFHLNNVLLSWFYIVTCTWNCLLMDMCVFHMWHQITWCTEIHVRRDCKDYLNLHVWVLRMWIYHLFLFIWTWEIRKSLLAVFWCSPRQ